MRSLICSLSAGVFGAFLGISTTASAATIGLTLTPSTDPMLVTGGETITWTVGITPATVITSYVLDIQYDMSELTFVNATQLVEVEFVPGFVAPLGWFEFPDPNDLTKVVPGDPATYPTSEAGSSGLATSSSGRAAIFSLKNSLSTADLFSLTFTVDTPPHTIDGSPDLTVGLLDTAANDISPLIGGAPLVISPDTVSASIGAVPEPTSLLLIAAPLMGLLGLRRRFHQV